MAVHADTVPDTDTAADRGGKSTKGLGTGSKLYGDLPADGFDQAFFLDVQPVIVYFTADTVADQLI